MLRVVDLVKRFETPPGAEENAPGANQPPAAIVDLPALSLAAGDQVALLGSSGSGKTTLLHLLAGILRADSGTIEYTVGGIGGASGSTANPTDLTQMSEVQRDHFRGQHIGYIFQTHHLLPGLTAMENVLMGMSFTGRSADRKWAAHLLDRVGLSHRLSYKPGKMSVGQQQRVAVARALANRPSLVLADEPTGALDTATARQTLELIQTLCTEVNAALLLVTHDLDIAARLSKRIDLAQINRAARPAPAGGAK